MFVSGHRDIGRFIAGRPRRQVSCALVVRVKRSVLSALQLKAALPQTRWRPNCVRGFILGRTHVGYRRRIGNALAFTD